MDSRISPVVAAVGSLLLGKERQVRLALTCMVAGGHLLIEDVPGMGKTLLAHSLARALGLSYCRVQFTSDLLPADILGASVFERDSGTFRFQQGPIFTQVLMADEINRTTPKTQSALLEAMEEGQVTSDGVSRPLPTPFFVIATQNPSYQMGTYPLPESQLDRFLMRLSIGYPNAASEKELMRGSDRRQLLHAMQAVAAPELLVRLREEVESVHTSDALIDYIYRLVQQSRRAPEFAPGLSPRGTLSLLRASKAWALIEGRRHTVPEDVQAVLSAVVDHRLRNYAPTEREGGRDGETLSNRLLAQVDVLN